MADEEVNGESDEIQEKNQKKTAKYDSGAADLEKVTDYAEEKEISTKDFSGVSLRAAFTIMQHFPLVSCFAGDIRDRGQKEQRGGREMGEGKGTYESFDKERRC